MALRYRQDYFENGNIADPTPTLRAFNEFAGEWQYLDRDNLAKNAVVEANVIAGTFVSVTSDPQSTDATPDTTSTGWQYQDASNNTLNSVTVTPADEALLVVEWSGSHQFDTSYGTLGRETVTIGSLTYYAWDSIRYRLTVDGIVIAQTGWLTDGQRWNGPYLVGATPVTPGPRVVRLEIQMARIVTGLGTIYSACINVPTLKARELVVTTYQR